MQCVAAAVSDGRITTFLLADHPAQRQEFSSRQLAGDILAAGGEPVVCLAMTSSDRYAALAKLQDYYRDGVRHFLFVSGNYPEKMANGLQKPVYDIDSVQLLMLLENFPATGDIVKGCAVSPFKTFESEQVWQYEKLRRKISVGADFAVTQLGFDLRKFDELLRFCCHHDITTPMVANIHLADMQTAGLIQARKIPGVKIDGTLLRIMQQESSSRRQALARTAKILAVIQGLGYHGALLGSHSADFAELSQILDMTTQYVPDWQELPAQLDSNGSDSIFYYFLKDPKTGLNSSQPAPVALKHFPFPAYSFSYFVDWLIYVPQGPLFKLTGRFCHFCSTKKFWYGVLWLLEYLSKGLLYGCKMCGDCTLYACGFLCYRSGCPKKMLNGPCGGSIEGYCEVFPEKKRCYWVKVYHNMKGVRQHVTFVAPPIPAADASLLRTSSWINFFLGRDHRRMKFEDL